MKTGVPVERVSGERRVALIPTVAGSLVNAGYDVLIESGAGDQAGYPDQAYAEKGARIISDRRQLFESSEVILVVQGTFLDKEELNDLELLGSGQVLIGMLDPLGRLDLVQRLASRGVTAFALELLPRITRAQSMDVLSSMATVAGYKAALTGAEHLPRMFPMMMTAAGSIAPAKVLVIGAGVAGLQAIATARRLGAVVSGYDIRPTVKEQIESLGAKFVSVQVETEDAEDSDGYARDQDEETVRREQEQLAKVVAQSDVVITTAAVPGKKAPVIISADMVARMAPGSVIVDIAAERGGNCELTRPGKTIVEGGVTIIGPVNLAASVPYHASQMYAKNISAFLDILIKDGELDLNEKDEIIQGTLITKDGNIVNQKLLEITGNLL